MKTDCNTDRIEFHPHGRRRFLGRFDGGAITSDAGAALLREVDLRGRIVEQFAQCFSDHRDPARITHDLVAVLRQRIYALALGYEDLNDHERLRTDALLGALAAGPGKPLAGKSTLNRLELSTPENAPTHRYKKIALDPEKVERLFVDLFLQAHATAPERIVLDLDATDDPLHGSQEGRFFHGYYRSYCYLPLYIFSGEQLLCAKLRRADMDAAAGSVEVLAPMLERIRAAWPGVGVTIRADSGFCREQIMAWCEQNGVDYILGMAKNKRLKGMIGEELARAGAMCEASGEPARLFADLCYKTRKSWSIERRVVAKAEVLPKGDNPRFIVTSLKGDARKLYEDVYCARGEMENRIKEQQLQLFADRTSSHFMGANQIRLWLSSLAYTLLQTLRREGLRGTRMSRAQCETIRARLLKIGAQVRVSVRKVWVAFAEGYPWADIIRRVQRNLARWRPVPT